MKIYFYVILILSAFVVITKSSENKDENLVNENNEEADQILDQQQIEELFRSKVNQLGKAGRLKQIWNKFLNDGVNENFDNEDVSTNKHSAAAHMVKTTNTAHLLDTMSSIGLKISKEIMRNLTKRQADDSLDSVLITRQAPAQLCPFLQNKVCQESFIFRSIDGSCNNLEFPLLGKSGTPYKRLTKPAYDDGLEKARTLGKNGKELPNPRTISNTLFRDNFLYDNDHTHIIAFFGQFVTHDLSMASVSTDTFGAPLLCDCGNSNVNCLPMMIPSTDTILKMTCMKFTRSSSTFSTFDCKLGYREQLNLLTAYIDASQVYGVNDFKSMTLRELKGGLLKSSMGPNNKPFLPQQQDAACQDTNKTIQCFGAGDSRVNNNLGLVGLHTLFMREHNRIAIKLKKLNDDWSDDRLFNEARRILIGIYQHIVFTEYLPALIGKNFVRAFDLDVTEQGKYYSGYNTNVNPSVSNEFSTAAFRFGHSLVRSQMGRYNLNNEVMGRSVNISEVIFRPAEAYNKDAGGLDSLLLSIINDPPSRFDTNIADALQNHLFEVKVSPTTVIADDLAAVNINRGRDHGIASYNTFREKCGFPRARTFEDLKDLITPINIEKLAMAYNDVDDIDFYVGGLSENHINGALLGPTFSCIIALQFRDFKKGDRFFYENGPSNTAFNMQQLDEIRKSSLARVICNNLDLTFIQPNVFYQPRSLVNNTRILCSTLGDLDLSLWKENN